MVAYPSIFTTGHQSARSIQPRKHVCNSASGVYCVAYTGAATCIEIVDSYVVVHVYVGRNINKPNVLFYSSALS